MAFPPSKQGVTTNLTDAEYEELMHCLDTRRPGEFVTVEDSLFASYGEWTFKWRGNRYKLSESFEVVCSVQKLTVNPMLPRPPVVIQEKQDNDSGELESLIKDVFG